MQKQIMLTVLVVALGIAIVAVLRTTVGRETAMILGSVIGLGGSALIAWITKRSEQHADDD